MSDRIDHGTEPWCAIPHRILRDARLTAKAKGGLVTLLSHEDGWIRSAIGILQRECAIGRDQAQSIMAELVTHGYAIRETVRDDTGIHTRYLVGVGEPTTTATTTGGFGVDGKPGGRETRRAGTPSTEVEALDVESLDVESKNAPMMADAARLCELLADLIAANGAKRPTITPKWRDVVRLMIERDGRTVAQVEAVIRWSQADEFWRANILSMGKVRAKFDTLVLQSRRGAHPINAATAADSLAWATAEPGGAA